MTNTQSTIDKILSDAEIEEMAKSLQMPAYNAAVLNANNAYNNTALSLDNALAEYKSGIDEREAAAEKAVTDYGIKTGMGRSTYAQDRLAQAFADIGEEVVTYQKQIDAQKLSAVNQRDAALAQLAADLQSNINNSIFDIRSQQQSLYQWQKEFELALQQLNGVGSGGSSATSNPTAEEIYKNKYNSSSLGAGSGLTDDLQIVGSYMPSDVYARSSYNKNKAGAGGYMTKSRKVVGPYGL